MFRSFATKAGGSTCNVKKQLSAGLFVAAVDFLFMVIVSFRGRTFMVKFEAQNVLTMGSIKFIKEFINYFFMLERQRRNETASDNIITALSPLEEICTQIYDYSFRLHNQT